MKTIDKDLLIDCSSKGEANDVFSYLESQGEKVNRKAFKFVDEISNIKWHFVGFCKDRNEWTVAREHHPAFGDKVISAKEFLGKTEIKPSSLVGREESMSSFPSKWCLKITDDNKQVLDAWRRQQPGFINLISDFCEWLISDKNDGTYTNWCNAVPGGYTEITYEEFVTNVHPRVWIDETKPGMEEAFVSYSDGSINKIKTKPLIEDVQSIGVNLRTKKQINKLKF